VSKSSSPPPAGPGDSEPATPSQPGVALWSDSDSGSRPPVAGFAGLVATPADQAMPTIGHIGRYALKHQLGSGGLGTVFAAHDPLLSRLIAVKTLNVEINEEERESFNTLFINEARAAGGLSHPHIVTVFDAGISDNRAYIAMELLKGRDLRQLRSEGWRATPAQAALIVRRVADALAFAHSKGVIHRDIKPANIFMVGRTQPRVLDFGIARVAHRHEGGDTMPGAGSPYYMAPEQVKRLPADRRADVFSLGVVLYELLTDVKPFQGQTLKEITNAVLTHEPPLACKVDKTVPKALADIVARAMAKDPEQRFRSARSFARELRQWLDANPVAPEAEAAPAPAAPTAAKPAVPALRRAPLVATGALALAALLASALGWQHQRSAAATALAAVPHAARPDATVKAPVATVAETVAPTLAVPPPAATAPTSVAAPAPAVLAATSAAAVSATDALLLATIVPTEMPPVRPAPAGATPHDEAAATNGPPAHRVDGAPPLSGNVAAKESAKDRRAREAREREAKDRDAQVAAAALVPPQTGTVKMAISPWGQVEVDGAPSGASPPLTELKLAEGRHQIVVRNGDFAPYSASINVVGGQVVSLRYKFGS
jgi:eukaryotic-like serine/threonine-protein kinase